MLCVSVVFGPNPSSAMVFKSAVAVTVQCHGHGVQVTVPSGGSGGCASQGDRRDRAVPCGATVFKLAAVTVPVTVPVTLRLTRKLAQARHRDWHAAGCRQSRFKCQCQWS